MQLFTTVLPEQILVGVQVNVTVFTSEPVPPGPVHEIEYVVVTVGETVRQPDTAPPVEKFVPVHDVAFDDDHVSVDD